LRRHPGDLPVLVGAHRQHAGRDRDGHLLLAHAPGTPALARGGPVGRGTAQVTGAHPLAAAFVAAALLLPPAPLPAQVAPPATGGAAALARQLAGLGTVKRVLVIGAHPDDEDTSLLALL